MRTESIPDAITLDESMLGGYGGFPDQIYLISVGDGKYAANNVSLSDGQSINGLAAFPSLDDVVVYNGLLAGLGGDPVKKSFEEARKIAISKPTLSCLLLFVDGVIVDVHYVR